MRQRSLRRGALLKMGFALLVLFFLAATVPSATAQQVLGTPEQIRDYLDRYNSLTPQQQQSLRDRMTPEQQTLLDRLLMTSGTGAPPVLPSPPAAGAAPAAKTITAGVPTKLTYTVTARNLSGVPVANPVIKDNGKVLNNNDAVKTGGNQDNILEVGETWTWTYSVTVTGTMGQQILNTATIEGPDDPNKETNPGNNTSTTVVEVLPPPGNYDLSVTKTVAAAEQSIPGMPPEHQTETRTQTLNECNTWKQVKDGGHLGTKDTWDISTLPAGTTFDFKYDAQSVPDRYIIQYPVGNTVYDSGWRGVQSYITNNPQMFPGGLSGPGVGEKNNAFTKGASNSVLIIVYGPHPGTAWSYSIRANCP